MPRLDSLLEPSEIGQILHGMVTSMSIGWVAPLQSDANYDDGSELTNAIVGWDWDDVESESEEIDYPSDSDSDSDSVWGETSASGTMQRSWRDIAIGDNNICRPRCMDRSVPMEDDDDDDNDDDNGDGDNNIDVLASDASTCRSGGRLRQIGTLRQRLLMLREGNGS
jgi:hypothetical protein